MTFGYPVMLDLGGVNVLVVGGGRVALRKAQGLAAAGALVTVVAPDVADELAELAAEVRRRAYVADDVTGHRLVITATDDPTVNAAVAADATAAGVWVNSADDPDNCTFILPAVARRGSITISVSTDGASPALASHLRRHIEREVLSEQVERASRTLAAQRAELQAQGISTESIDWTDRVRDALGE